MLTVFNVFFIYITTKWKYRRVVCDLIYSAMLEAARPVHVCPLDTSGGNGRNRDRQADGPTDPVGSVRVSTVAWQLFASLHYPSAYEVFI